MHGMAFPLRVQVCFEASAGLMPNNDAQITAAAKKRRTTHKGNFIQSDPSGQCCPGAQAAATFAHRPIDRGDVAAQANAGPLAGNGQAVGRR